MRNLKRALSLALTAVMVLGMMVIGAGAVSYDDFSDKDKIVNTEAVSTLVSLGVIAGKDDGSYDPSGIVTRAELAKMICVVLNSGKDPQLGTVSSYTYSDTVGHWAAAYIEYCTTMGIVAGDGTGKFNPSATVTGAQAAKMLLVAAGYNASVEGLVGANWLNATNVLANAVGLYDELTINPAEGLSRDSAAQMVYNALSAKAVSYTYSLVSDGKGGFSTISQRVYKSSTTGKEDVTVLEDRFNAVKIEGIVLKNEVGSVNGASATDEGKTYIAVTNYGTNEDQTSITDGSFKVSTDASVLGKAVTLYAKAGSSTDPSKATVIGGVMISDDNTVVTLTSGSTSKTIATRLDDNDMDVNSDTVYVTNYTENSLFSGSTYNVNGVEITAIDNDGDDVAEYVLQNFYVFGKVSSYTTKDDGTISVSAVNTPVSGYGLYDDTANNYTASSVKFTDFSDVVGEEDVAKDDYVLAQVMGGKLYVTPAESVELTPSSTKGSNMTVDGTTYKQAGTVSALDDSGTTTLASAVEIDTAASFYMDQYGYVVYVTDVDSTSDYLYVTAATTADGVNDVKAKVVFADGTTDTVTVSKLNGSSISTTDTVDPGVYTYSVSGEKYKLTNGTNSSSFNATTINAVATGTKYIAKNNATLVTADGTKYANSSTIFVVKDGDSSYTTYTGIASVPNLTAPTAPAVFTAAVAYGTDNYADIVFVTVSSVSGSSALDKSIYFLNKNPEVTKDSSGDSVYTYTVIYKGEKTTLEADSNLSLSDTGLYLAPTVNGNNVITDEGTPVAGLKTVTAESGVIELASTFSDGTTTYGPTFTVNSDTVILDVDDEDVTEVGLGYITTGTSGDDVVVVPDKDNAALAAYIFILE